MSIRCTKTFLVIETFIRLFLHHWRDKTLKLEYRSVLGLQKKTASYWAWVYALLRHCIFKIETTSTLAAIRRLKITILLWSSAPFLQSVLERGSRQHEETLEKSLYAPVWNRGKESYEQDTASGSWQKTVLVFSNHSLDAFLSLYRALWSLQTCSGVALSKSFYGCSMNIPFKVSVLKAFFTFNWYSCFFLAEMMNKNIQSMIPFGTVTTV